MRSPCPPCSSNCAALIRPPLRRCRPDHIRRPPVARVPSWPRRSENAPAVVLEWANSRHRFAVFDWHIGGRREDRPRGPYGGSVTVEGSRTPLRAGSRPTDEEVGGTSRLSHRIGVYPIYKRNRRGRRVRRAAHPQSSRAWRVLLGVCRRPRAEHPHPGRTGRRLAAGDRLDLRCGLGRRWVPVVVARVAVGAPVAGDRIRRRSGEHRRARAVREFLPRPRRHPVDGNPRRAPGTGPRSARDARALQLGHPGDSVFRDRIDTARQRQHPAGGVHRHHPVRAARRPAVAAAPVHRGAARRLQTGGGTGRPRSAHRCAQSTRRAGGHPAADFDKPARRRPDRHGHPRPGSVQDAQRHLWSPPRRPDPGRSQRAADRQRPAAQHWSPAPAARSSR